MQPAGGFRDRIKRIEFGHIGDLNDGVIADVEHHRLAVNNGQGYRVRTTAGTVEADHETQLARIESELAQGEIFRCGEVFSIAFGAA